MYSQPPTSVRSAAGRSYLPRLRTVWALLSLLLIPGLAHADTVYLKNGRTIRASKVTVTADKVILEQSGNRVEFPLSLVERVEEDRLESDVLEPVDRDELPIGSGAGDEPEGGDGEGDGDGEEAEVDPKTTREYWQTAVKQIRDARAELQDSLERLKREERAFMFSHRSTAETRRQIEAVEQQQAALDEQMEALRREARRLQIPPGWLRSA